MASLGAQPRLWAELLQDNPVRHTRGAGQSRAWAIEAMPACAKKTNRKGQSKLFSVTDTLGRARAGNKGGIEARHSLGGCRERADAGLCPPCCAVATRARGDPTGWVAGHGQGLFLSKEGKLNVATMSPCVPGGGRWPGTRRFCRDSRTFPLPVPRHEAEAAPALPPRWLWDIGLGTERWQGFGAHLCPPKEPGRDIQPIRSWGGTQGSALGRDSVGMDTGHWSGDGHGALL